MPIVPINPEKIAPPAANYQHGILAEGASRILHTSGVVPVKPDGTVPEDISEQAEVIWKNIDTTLGSHKAASTLLVVAQLAQESWKMEVAVVAISDS